MFVSNFLAPLIGLRLLCAFGFWAPAPSSVDAITTKSSLPLILDNSSDISHSHSHSHGQFVHIRSTVNQPTRTFLLQQKNSLSPVQQTHILDDVQKNQRVHYQASYGGDGGDDNRPKKSLTGAGAPATPLFHNNNNNDGFSPSHQSAFEPQSQSQPQPATLYDYANFNALSAPPLQTLVLSPQQSLPTSPSFANEYYSPSPAATAHRIVAPTVNAASAAYRQPSGGGGGVVGVFDSPNLSSASAGAVSSGRRVPFSAATVAATASGPAAASAAAAAATATNVGRQSAAAANFVFKSSAAAAQSYSGGPIRHTTSAPPYYSAAPLKSEISSYSANSSAVTGYVNDRDRNRDRDRDQDRYPKYEPTLAASSFLSTASKTYHAKDTASVFSPFVDKPKYVDKDDLVSATATATATAAAAATASSPSADKFVKEVYLKMNPEILIAKDRQKFFQQLLEGNTNRNVAGNESDGDGDGDGDGEFELASGANGDDQTVAQNNLGNIRSQFEKELLRQLKQASGSIAQADFPDGNVSEFSLPNGQKVQISKDYNRLLLEEENVGGGSNNKIKAIVVKQLPSTTGAPKANLLEELTKGVVPPGAEFEVIKRNKDGALEEISKLPQNIPQKKVTFVILEEQPDGTVKVQGVRGSEKESLKESGEEVDTIIKKIKQGELKLPPSTRLSPKQSSASSASPSSSTSSPLSVKKHSRYGNGNGNGNEYETKSKRKSAASGSIGGGGGEIKTSKRKEQQASVSAPDKHFIPTPIVQTYTTPESDLKLDSYASASASAATTEDENSFQYYSSPGTFYVDGDKYTAAPNYIGSTLSPSPSSNGDGAAAAAAANILNELATAGGGGESWNRANLNSAISEASAAKIAALDNLGLFHLNNSGYIASLFSALKTQSQSQSQPPSPATDILQLPLLPTTFGHRNVQQSDDRNSTGVGGGGGGSGSGSGVFPNDDTYETAAAAAAAAINNNKKDNFYKKRDRNAIRKAAAKKPLKETRKDNDEEESHVQETKSEDVVSNENSTLSDVLKKEGFYAMARFLRQSGLDSILNDTGPFTLFIPTDKAFRTLLIQLGGPDKAEDKFKENPRLLSGLLLHHVIPGAFRVNTLQDEMTGVSLAGTQLRVNTYTTHDIEWNDITVVTVNGAKILDEKDIVIPQGIAHAIDRVMFPLPVGNLLQSLQADRENRYSNFLKILEESELSYLLTGGKTFTLFAPLNRAFTHAEFTKILADANESKSFVLRHIVPGALYSAGMKYYQVRDSMEDGQQITLYKEAGKIKVNNAHVVTRNIPATNGVIHAIDAFL